MPKGLLKRLYDDAHFKNLKEKFTLSKCAYTVIQNEFFNMKFCCII